MTENKDKENILDACNEFADLMADRMIAKYDEGLRGWDNPDLAIVFQSKLDTAQVKGKWVDVANFAMMLDRFQRLAK